MSPPLGTRRARLEIAFDRAIVETVVPRASLRLTVRLLGLAALLKGIDLWLELPATLAVAREAPRLHELIPPPFPAWSAHFTVTWLIASTLLLLLRPAPRAAAAVIATLGLWLVTSSGYTYSNHLYLLSLLALAASFAPVGERASWVFGWPGRLMQIQVSLVYGFGALAKVNPSFLSGRLLSASSDLPAVLDRPALLATASVLVVLTEAFLAVALWSSTFRPLAIAVGIALHVGILLGLPREIDLVVFAISCLAVYPLFGATRPGPAPVARSAARPGHALPV